MRSKTNTWLVHVSTGSAFPKLASDGSYVPSTRRNRVSHGQYILCGVFVSIMFCATLWTTPVSGSNIHFGHTKPTRTAGFATGEKTVNFCNRFSISTCFVFQHFYGSSDRCIIYAFCQTMISDHSSDIKIFHKDIVKSSHNIRSNLIKVILAAVGNVGVDSSDFKFLTFPSTTAPLTSGEDFLCFRNSERALR